MKQKINFKIQELSEIKKRLEIKRARLTTKRARLDEASARRAPFDTIRRGFKKNVSPVNFEVRKIISHFHKSYFGEGWLVGLSLLAFLIFTFFYPLIAKAEIVPVTAESNFSQSVNPEFTLKTKGLINTSEAKTGKEQLELGSSKISVQVKHQTKEITAIPVIETIPARQDQFKIKIQSPVQFFPGKYKIKVNLDTSLRDQTIEQDFNWGVLAINPDQSIYKPNQEAFIGMAVLDDEGEMVSDAKVLLEIINPQGKNTILSTENKTIKISPQINYKGITELPDYYTNYKAKEVGEYKLRLSAETEDGIRKMEDRFYVEEKPDFEVKRDAHTRIYPVISYPVKIEVKANAETKGPIKEYVPKSFKITENPEFTVEEKGQFKVLTWNKSFKVGEKKVLEYIYDAPDTSPQFYLSGPLQIGESKNKFEEIRQWQIASDATEDTFRVTTYELRDSLLAFSTATYTLTLQQDLESDYFAVIRPGGITGTSTAPDANHARIDGDPFSNFGTTTNSDELRLSRGGATGNWQGTVVVTECLGDNDTGGFRLRDAVELDFATSDTSDTKTSSPGWSDIDQVGLYVGGASSSGTVAGSNAVGHARVWPSSTATVNGSRDLTGKTAAAADFTVYAIEWGSEWNIQRARIQGAAGGAGMNATAEYVTQSISSVTRANTWVYGQGHVTDGGIGDSFSGRSVTLGDGVNQNASETLVACGGEYSDTVDVETYIHEHTDLAVDYEFGTDGGTPGIVAGYLTGTDTRFDSPGGAETYDNSSSTVQYTKGYRFASMWSSLNGTGSAFPRPYIWARPTASNTVSWGRGQSGQAGAYWLNVADFSGITYETGIDISGTSNSSGTVNLAINSIFQLGQTATISGGTWTISGATKPSSGNTVTVWIGGAAVADESTGVTKYDGIGDITGMVLDQHVLSIGSVDDQSLTVTNLGQYDNDQNEDVMHSANLSTLNVDADNAYTDEKIDILSGDTLTISGIETLTTHDVAINGTLTSGGNSTYYVSGSWDNNSVFTCSTSTITFIASSGTETINSSGASTYTFNNLTLGALSGTATWNPDSTLLDINGNLTISFGTLSLSTNNPNFDLEGNLTISASGTLTASSSANFNIGGSWDNNSGVFTHNSGDIVFDALTFGKTIESGGDNFNNIEFNSSTGGWTVQTDNFTCANNLTITSVAVTNGFSVNSVTATVQGIYSIADALTGYTTWPSATLYLNSGTAYTIGSKTQSTESYNILQTGANTDIRLWNSSASTTTVDSTGSLYSQDHANTNGDLYIWGDYHTGTNDYWSYATDFEGTGLGGSERQVDVKLYDGAGVTVDSSDTLAAIGTGANRTTVDYQSSGGYDLTVSASGTINFQYTDFDHLNGPDGINIQASATVTSLANCAFDNLVGTAATDDAFITVASSVIGSAQTGFTACQFDNTGAGAEFNVNRTGSDDTGWWYFDTSTGTFDGEANDGKDGASEADPGMIRWDDSTWNTAPNDPTDLVQKKTDDTVLAVGDWTDETSVKFTATASDTDNPDTLYLEIEVKDINTAFDATGTTTGSGVAYSGSPVTVTTTVSGLSDANEYHWRARIVDEATDTSSWVAYGGNGDGSPADRDFGTDTTAPTGGTVYDGLAGDQDWNDGSLTTLEANWTGFDSTISGLDKYEYAMRREPDDYYWNAGGSTWQAGESFVDNGVTTTATVNSMNLQTGVLYYASVRAVDNAGNTGSAVDSNGQKVSPTLSFTMSANSITFADLNNANSWTDSKTADVTTSTNATSGYTVSAYITQLLTSTAYPGETIANFYGTWANPELWPGGTYGFGYTSNDTLVQGSDRFVGGDEYAGFSQVASGDIFCDHTDAVNGSTGAVTDELFTITFKIAVSTSQVSSAYQTQTVCIVTANY